MPINHYIFILILSFPIQNYAWFFSSSSRKPFLVFLESSGDRKNTGRTIGDTYESTLTLIIAQALKTKVLELDPSIKIIINRSPGEEIIPLQNANFSNKINTDLYISINAFAQTTPKPSIYIYQFSYADNTISKYDDLTFYPIDKIYLMNELQTTSWNTIIHQALLTNKLVEVYGIYKIPCKPLLGIKASACALEFGLNNQTDWQLSIDSIATAILTIINHKQ